MPSRFCCHTSPNFMGARFTGLIKTRRRWTTPRKFGLFCLKPQGRKVSKKWLLLETFSQNFPLLERNGYYWKVLAKLLEKCLIVEIFDTQKSFHY